MGSAIQYVLADRRPRTPTFVIGSAAIFRHVADAGQRIVNGTDHASSAEIVVVAGHDDFKFDELRTATQAVLNGAEMIAAGRDRTFPACDGYWPGTGAIVAALEYATEQTARSVGKPDTMLFETALDRLGPGRSLMVGDRLDADLGGAAAAGLDAAIVLTGVTTREQAEAARRSGAGGDRRQPVRAGNGDHGKLGPGERRPADRHAGDARPHGIVCDRQPARRRRPRRTRARQRPTARSIVLASPTTSSRRAAWTTRVSWPQPPSAPASARWRSVGTGSSRPSPRRCPAAMGTLGVLPGGRGNDFARALQIPLDPAEACAVLADGAITAWTWGRSGRAHSSASPAVASTRSSTGSPTTTTLIRGNLVYTYGALRALARWRPATFKVRIDDGESREMSGFTVAVANSNYYGGGMMLAPAADLQDGMLDVVIIKDMRRLRFLRLLPTVFHGRARARARGGDDPRAVSGDLGVAPVHDVRRRRSDRRTPGHGSHPRRRCAGDPPLDGPHRAGRGGAVTAAGT